MFDAVIAQAVAEAIENLSNADADNNDWDVEGYAVSEATEAAWRKLNLPDVHIPTFVGTLTEEQVNAVCLTIMYCASTGAIHHLADNREKGNPYQMLMSIAFDSIERIIQEAVNAR
jgi:uncharacterized protein